MPDIKQTKELLLAVAERQLSGGLGGCPSSLLFDAHEVISSLEYRLHMNTLLQAARERDLDFYRQRGII